jgi:VanZ family protein
MIRIAILYAVALVALIAVADAGWLPHVAERIHDLPHCDKVLHFAMYGLLALVTNLALLSGTRWPTLRTIVLGTTAVLIVATVEEYSNQFVAVRDYSLGDLAANYLGIFVIGVLPLIPRLAATRDAAAHESATPPAAQ